MVLKYLLQKEVALCQGSKLIWNCHHQNHWETAQGFSSKDKERQRRRLTMQERLQLKSKADFGIEFK